MFRKSDPQSIGLWVAFVIIKINELYSSQTFSGRPRV